ncbi:hypothetical protein BGZ60DRAFT_424715 [Tricladium varicosporioides]|nr:hypothetical protein BGZ60DRAFT_424715 [Hymenoscyphus varicosporioides]
MASLMPPPALPSYSLRVQLFAPNAHITGDKPIRCFRVVTTPEVTIREFCEEASRIHEINYGKPLAIKKCQDDQEFDVTQNEIIGNLFPNTSIIRIVHANASAASFRDESVPPTSALRFNPSNTKSLKRSREGSTARNSSGPPSARNSNKRQRLELDPDHPLPSREIESSFGGPLLDMPETNVVPNSQESIILGGEHLNNGRHVRADFQIPETPSPPRTLVHDGYYERYSTNNQHLKSVIPKSSQVNSEGNISSPLKAATARSESRMVNSPRAKSTSYHIERATERGRSISTPATTPLVGENRPVSARNGTPVDKESQAISASPSSSSAKQKQKELRSKNEESIYDDFSSGEAEAVAILNRNKSNLRNRKGQNKSSPSLVSPNHTVNTPPNGSQQQLRSHDMATLGTLPLTPNSKEHRAKQEQRQNSEARKAKNAAAEAAEQRRCEVEKLRVAEEARLAEEKREQREEQGRLKVEERRRAEEERAAKAAKFKKEREEKQRREAEEKRKREEEKRLKQEQERITREKLKAEQLEQEKAQVEEAERVRKAEEERLQLSQAAEKVKKDSKTAKSKSMSHVPNTTERDRQSSSASAKRPQSSTPFIPSGRKSVLKNPMPSPQAIGSSPVVLSQSPEFSGVGIEDAMPLPKEMNRRVSFAEEGKVETPIRPSTRILPPKFSTQKESTTVIPPPKKLSKAVPSERVSNSPIPVPIVPRFTKVSKSPIPPPKVPNSTKEPTPLKETSIPIPRREPSGAILPSKKEIPTPPPPRKSLTPPQASSTQVKQVPKKAPAPVVVVSSDDGSEEDIPAVVSPERVAKNSARRKSSPSPVTKSIAQPEPKGESEEEESEEDEDEEDEDAEMTSTRSSERDSRSPPVFNKHREQEIARPKKSKAEPESESSSEDDADDESEDVTNKSYPPSLQQERQVEEGESEEEEGSSGDVDEDEDVEMAEATPPELPAHKRKGNVLNPASSSLLNGLNSKDHTTDESQDTQEEINQQLTSSVYEARASMKSTSPVPNTSSAAPRPTFKVGASLKSLNAKKQNISRTNGVKTQAARRTVLIDASMSGSEEESESESESESSPEEDLPNTHPPPISSAGPTSAQKPKHTSDSSSDSSSGSDPESESENETTRARRALVAQVADFSSQGAVNGTQSKSQNQKTVNKTSSKKTQKTYGKSPSGKKVERGGFAFKLPGV